MFWRALVCTRGNGGAFLVWDNKVDNYIPEVVMEASNNIAATYKVVAKDNPFAKDNP